jgi:hypothetical protein
MLPTVFSLLPAYNICLPRQSLATVVSSDSTILASKHPVTFNSRVTGSGVLYPVQIKRNY